MSGVSAVAVWKDAGVIGEGVTGDTSSERVGGERWSRINCLALGRYIIDIVSLLRPYLEIQISD